MLRVAGLFDASKILSLIKVQVHLSLSVFSLMHNASSQGSPSHYSDSTIHMFGRIVVTACVVLTDGIGLRLTPVET